MPIVIALVLAALVGVVAAGCHEEDPVIQATPTPTNTADSGAQAGTPAAEPSADTAGTIDVTWTAISGSARQDPLGVLSGTPLVAQGSSLRAHRTVLFKPNAPDSTSAKGKYVYTLDLEADPGDPAAYKGTMALDWTMTIVRANSKSEFHAVYKGTAEATFDAAGGVVYDGLAKGSMKTTDTFWNGDTKLPPTKSSDWFVWGFKTPQ